MWKTPFKFYAINTIRWEENTIRLIFTVLRFVNEKQKESNHLSGNTFTTDTEKANLARCLEVERPRLVRMKGDMLCWIGRTNK